MADAKEEDDGMSSDANFVQIFLINIHIQKATNLVKADTFGKSDPYVRVSAFKTDYQTKVIKDDLNPVWEEPCEMTFFNDPKQLKFEVFDFDEGIGAGKDDPLGDAVVNLDFSPNNSGFEGELKLNNAKKGELYVKVQARKLVPSELEQRVDALQDKDEENRATIESLDQQIADNTDKNNAVQAEIDAVNANITAMTADIPNKEQQLKELQDEAKNMEEEVNTINAENNALEETFEALDQKQKEVQKELDDVKDAEDKKHTENGHLRNDIEDLKRQIEAKQTEKREREEEQRKAREDAELQEKERLKSEQEEQAKQSKPNSKDDKGDSTPLVSKDEASHADADADANNAQASGGCCCVVL